MDHNATHSAPNPHRTPHSTPNQLIGAHKTTPLKNNALVSQTSHNVDVEKTEDEVKRERRLKDIGSELNCQWIGPMDCEEFFQTFVPLPQENTPEITRELMDKLESVTTRKYSHENNFTKELCGVLNKMGNGNDGKIGEEAAEDTLVFRFTGDSQSVQDDFLKPDATVYDAFNAPVRKPEKSVVKEALLTGSMSSERCDFERAVFNLEAKLVDQKDGFDDSPKAPHFAKSNSEEAKVTRGQLVAQMRNLMRYQPRTHVFSILVHPKWARLIYADRSAAVVTKRLNLVQEEGRRQFLRFMSLMQPPKSDSYEARLRRGYDPTLEPANPDESRLFKEWVAKNESSCPWKINTAKPDSVIAINDNNNGRYLCSSHPVVPPELELLSRGTRIYFGVSIDSKKPIVIKDTWRYDVKDIHKEGDIYEKLAAGPDPVKNIPQMLAAADVGLLQPQATEALKHDIRKEADKEAVTLTAHVHHRIFFETVGFPLHSWKTAKELMEIIRDSIEAHWAAYVNKKILHRDVSVGNILIERLNDGKARGILSDWELSCEIPHQPDPRRTHRTGTWQFMSAMLLLSDDIRPNGAPAGHFYADDLESFFHSLLYHVYMHLPVASNIQELRAHIKKYFDQSEPSPKQDRYQGGDTKLGFFERLNRQKVIVLNNAPLTNLIQELREYFNERYTDASPKVASDRLLPGGKFGNPTEILKVIDKSLENESLWPKEDKIELDVFHRNDSGARRPDSEMKCLSNYYRSSIGSKRQREDDEPVPPRKSKRSKTTGTPDLLPANLEEDEGA